MAVAPRTHQLCRATAHPQPVAQQHCNTITAMDPDKTTALQQASFCMLQMDSCPCLRDTDVILCSISQELNCMLLEPVSSSPHLHQHLTSNR